MNKILILFLFCRLLLISSSLYVRDSSSIHDDELNSVRNSYYLITAPKVWTSIEESVCLVLLKQSPLPNAVINVRISSINGRELFAQKYQSLNSVSQCIRIPTAMIRAERALLNIELSDIVNETLEIRVKPSDGLTLIETSKPIYRPNERLEFRIIRLNDWLRPIDEQFQSVTVENSQSMPVMQWTHVRTSNGMLALDMPIAEDNYYGIWKIKVVNSKHMTVEKMFKIYDYEISNVIISVDSPNYLKSSDKQSVNKICVRNGFGQPLKGRMKAFVSYVKFNWARLHMLDQVTLPYEFKEFEMNGCYDLVIRAANLEWNSSKYSKRNLKMSFQFIDDTNGFIEEKFLEIPVVEHNLIITFPSVRLIKQYFKPGLPYFGHVMVVRPDYSPAPNEKLELCYQSRDMPWLSQREYVCKAMVSNSNGMVEFTIPPMNDHVKQIQVQVKSAEHTSIENRMILQPSYTPNNDYMTVRPLINKSHCNQSMVEFDIFFKNNIPKQVFYQVISRGVTHSPESYYFQGYDQWQGQNMISDSLDNYQIFTAKMIVKIPVQSALNNNLINRILVYYLDSNDTLVADSNVFLTTCTDSTYHSTRIGFEDTQNQSTVKLSIAAQQNSTCAFRVAQNKPYNSLKKINQFIEKFDIKQESGAVDKCQKMFNQRTGSEAKISPYSAPYDLESANSAIYDPVINYGDSWDSFNDIGLLVSSNARLDDSPCDWDLYTRDILTELSQMRNNQMKYTAQNRPTTIQRNQIRDIERSLFNEVFDWNLVNTDSSGLIDKHISRDYASNSGQLYADTVCMNKDSGITYARSVFDNKATNYDKHFRITIRSPKESRIGDSLLFKVFVEKSSAEDQICYPIELELESSDTYELVNKPKVVCICGHKAQPIDMLLRPTRIGLINVKVMAKYPNDWNSDRISASCGQASKVIRFPAQVAIKQMTVRPMGIVSTQVRQQIVCNNINENFYPNKTKESQDLTDMRTDSTDMIVTNELIEPLLRYIRTKMSSGHHNAIDSMSIFGASYYLLNYSDTTSIDSQNRNQLKDELTKSFQTLQTYRHSDGSYSVYRSHRHKSDLGLTVSVFKLLAQSKPYLSFVETGQRINSLHQTLIWIFEQQATDGCFHIARHQRMANIWPISFQDNNQLTGFVLASLLDAGLDLNSKHLTKAYDCLSQNSKTIMKNIKSEPLSAILYSYIQLLTGNTVETEYWIQSSDVLNNLDESYLFNREVLSYLALTNYLSNDLQSAKSLAEQLLKTSTNVWQTPISCYAIIKLWPLLKHKTTASVKVYNNDNQIQSSLVLSAANSVHRLDGHRISIENSNGNNGCLFVANNKVETHLANEPTNFEIKINGLDKGFVTCNRRRLTVCVKELKPGLAAIHPVVRMQMITGFGVDNGLMKKMIDSHVVVKYKKSGSELMLIMHQFHDRQQAYCFTVPVLRKQETYGTNRAFIKVYDYYNESVNDVSSYEIPDNCHIDNHLIQKD